MAYCIANNKKPFSNFTGLGLLELTSKLGVELIVRDKYTRDERCKDLISHIAELIGNELVLKLQNDKYGNLMLYESTDKAGVKRYVKKSGVRKAFLTVNSAGNYFDD